jgi:phospholipid-binding lipoprotein MlaA
MQRIAAGFFFVSLCLSGCATAQNKQDPWEPVNRKIYKFNRVVDRGIVRPVAKGYARVMPDIARKGATNFFRNIGMLVTTVNDALQLKGEKVPVDIMRIATNTIFGLGGLIDVATGLNIEQRDEEFGQTLGYWGVKSGPYVVLPFFGPSDVRDGLGLGVDLLTSPYFYWNGELSAEWGAFALDAINTRANLLPLDRVLEQQPDPYSFMRDTYLQRRQFLIHDGNPPRTTAPAGKEGESPPSGAPKSLRELEEEEFGDEPVQEKPKKP